MHGVIIGTCEPVVAELFFGVENSESRDENLRRLKHGSRLTMLAAGRRASEEFGEPGIRPETRGRVVGPMDMLIAAIALTLGDCVVVSTDADMRDPGLTVKTGRVNEDGCPRRQMCRTVC